MSVTHNQLDLAGDPTVGEILERIREESRDESEKGRWFEQLFMRVALQEPEFEIDEIWRWADWPEREALTGKDGRDIGIDLVARRTTGEWVAVQCKCYDDDRRLSKGEVDKFMSASQHIKEGSESSLFTLRWIVATCRWGRNAEQTIRGVYPHVSQIDFNEYLDIQLEKEDAERPVQEPWPLQHEAIEDAIEGLSNHDRGSLVMACGTGKTFVSLRIAEETVPDGGHILFAAPTIALVSQARRQWLRHTTRKIKGVVVCSDSTAGGRNEEDKLTNELECPVTTDPSGIARELACVTDTGVSDTNVCEATTRVVFCTYQSLRCVTEAQKKHGVPDFDLAIADEAHRTTGALIDGAADDKVDFREFHDDERLRAKKRLYMTATPRVYTDRSKNRLEKKGVGVVDMSNLDVYGPEFHRLPFSKAVENNMLSDYRVIVLGVNQASVTQGLKRRFTEIGNSGGKKPKRPPKVNDMTRVLGVLLAVNGVTEGKEAEQPGKLVRTMAFANSIVRSKWYAEALMDSLALSSTTRRIKLSWLDRVLRRDKGEEQENRAMKVQAVHMDASSSALKRNLELRALANANKKGECRIACNVRLFTEGVDVPSLDAVAFLDPRSSQIDIVQAVGRVMRKAPGKRFGYIVVPVVIEPGRDIVAALEKNTEGYKTVGKVLRALQSHDSRLAKSPASFVKVYENKNEKAPGSKAPGSSRAEQDSEREYIQRSLELKEAEQGIYTHIAAASGLGKPGQLAADEIAWEVRQASAVFQKEVDTERLAKALDMSGEGRAREVCTVAALMLCNACLLQRRLNNEPQMKDEVLRLDRVGVSDNPKEVLRSAWKSILAKDYRPVYEPALAVLEALPEGKAVDQTICKLASCANRIADSLSELGYDHAGPLYHRILGSAKSDGAFYTNNVSAVMLAQLAFGKDAYGRNFIDWSDPEAVGNLRIMDPACGTGTLLMATLQTIKNRVAKDKATSDQEQTSLYKRLVEDVLCGLDINRHGVQLAACNMTLGAPSVDYRRMNLVTMPHGIQSDGTPKAGSLEILTAADDTLDLSTMRQAPQRDLESLEAEQVDESAEIGFPLKNLDAVIMNAPFTDNKKRGRKFTPEAVKKMQKHELDIRDHLAERDSAAGRVITSNSIRTFFTPLADRLLRSDKGVLAKVIPTTACTGPSGVEERRFLAERFHVETIVTTHDPKRPNFSENTGIHESLLICRRRKPDQGWEKDFPARFVSLRKMPANAKEAAEAVQAISSGNPGRWGTVHHWPAERVQEGDWTPCQWYDGDLAQVAWGLDHNERLESAGDRYEIGPEGRGIQGAYIASDEKGPDAVPGFHSVSGKLRRTLEGKPDVWYVPRQGKEALAERYKAKRSNLLVPMRFDTVSGRLTALWTEYPSFGWWVPIAEHDEARQKALVAWWNSTPVRLMLLNKRGKKLTYPTWNARPLRQTRIPKPDNSAWSDLRAAYDKVCRIELLPMKQATECEARRIIDKAAAKALGISDRTVSDWRRRLANEPTVSNAYAQEK